MNYHIDYDSVCSRLESLISSSSFISAFANAASFIYHELYDVNWVGFYFYDNVKDKLILGPFQGKPACVEIAPGKGVCGYTFSNGQTAVVPDVHKFPGHIACDADSRSEIVVPIRIKGEVAVLLDIDSTSVNRFSDADSEGLERVAEIIAGYTESYFPFNF